VVQHPRGQWGWTQFEHDLVVPEEAKAALAKGKKAELTIVSKALDSHWNVQPENAEPNINPRGVAINHWYRVSVTLDPSLQTSGPTNPQAEATNNERFANTPSGGKFRVPFAEAGWDNESGVQGSSKEVSVPFPANQWPHNNIHAFFHTKIELERLAQGFQQ